MSIDDIERIRGQRTQGKQVFMLGTRNAELPCYFHQAITTLKICNLIYTIAFQVIPIAYTP